MKSVPLELQTGCSLLTDSPLFSIPPMTHFLPVTLLTNLKRSVSYPFLKYSSFLL